MLNTINLFDMQRVLDQRIVKENNIKHNRFRNLIMALLDEIGECAKETRCFKDWSKKPPSAHAVILEEYVDGLHFVLSLGLLDNFDAPDVQENLREFLEMECKGTEKSADDEDLTQRFLDVYADVMAYGNGAITYFELFSGYLYLGLKLGFNVREIESAYFYKNNKNHVREDFGFGGEII